MNSDNYICGKKIYFLVYICLHIVIFICSRCGGGLRVFDPQQIVCNVWLDSYNYNRYVVQLFVCNKWFYRLRGRDGSLLVGLLWRLDLELQ